MTERQFRQLQRGDTPGRASKYGNVTTRSQGLTFQSALEARHYRELTLRLKAGEIRHLERQVPIPLVVNGVEVCTYVADFTYEERTRLANALPGLRPVAWVPRIVDTKAPPTRRNRAYRIKKKLLAALGHEIVEVEAGRPRRPRRKRR